MVLSLKFRVPLVGGNNLNNGGALIAGGLQLLVFSIFR